MTEEEGIKIQENANEIGRSFNAYVVKAAVEYYDCIHGNSHTGYFDFKYQNVFRTREKEHGNSKFYTHILVNSVAYTDGKFINSWVGNLNDFCSHVEMVTGCQTRLYIKNGAGSSGRVELQPTSTAF